MINQTAKIEQDLKHCGFFVSAGFLCRTALGSEPVFLRVCCHHPFFPPVKQSFSMRKSLCLPVLFFISVAAFGQANSGARLFLDIPNIYAVVPDVEGIRNQLGAGLETAFNVGTHWSVARVGGGALFTLDPQVRELQESFLVTPFVLLETGAGIYRSNGNHCARTNQNAFTALGKIGLRYTFHNQSLRDSSGKSGVMDYTVGAEFGYFFLRDMFRNIEVFLGGSYLTKSEVVMGNVGIKMFLNLRADR